MNDQNSQIQIAEGPAQLMRQSTDVAGVCKEIVVKTAMQIAGKKYVRVEGWQSIAAAYGCLLTVESVTRVEGGVVAVGAVRRMSDGSILSRAEGYVGDTEAIWGDREEYAKRGMAQTRAMSRAARSAFAFVVTMMDEGLSTTPAEEVPPGGFPDGRNAVPMPQSTTEGRKTQETGKGAGNDRHSEILASTVLGIEVVENKDHDPSKPAQKKNWKVRYGIKLADDPQGRTFGSFDTKLYEFLNEAWANNTKLKVKVSQSGKFWNLDAAEADDDLSWGEDDRQTKDGRDATDFAHGGKPA